MLFFPQLSTGASALYPVVRAGSARSIVNVLEGGSRIVGFDAEARRRRWSMHASGLTDAERASIDELFVATEGALREFTLFDPAGNLLRRSEEFEDPVWIADPLLVFTSGQSDPFGTTRATRLSHAAGSAQGLTQEIAGPGNFAYTFSVWAKTSSSGSLVQSAAAGTAVAEKIHVLSGSWRRYAWPVELGADTDHIGFGFAVPAGSVVDVFGAQVEAQPGASDYKVTDSESGVIYPVRFESDALRFRAQGTDVFDVVIDLVTAGA